MLETMRFAALIHPAVGAGILSSERILEMATIDSACALGLDDKVGSLEAGKRRRTSWSSVAAASRICRPG